MDDPSVIDLQFTPLTVAATVQALSILCTLGKVTIINAPIDPDAQHRILRCLSQKLSDDDRQWIKQTVAEEVSKLRGE